MSSPGFDDYVFTTLSGASNSADGSPLSLQQKSDVAAYLRSPGSGPDAVTSFELYLSKAMQASPPELPVGTEYLGFSGKDSSGQSNYQNATQYRAEAGVRTGIIGDTPWGEFIVDLDVNPARHPEFGAMADGLQSFMKSQGIEPFDKKNYAGALHDIMWNAGSSKYFENAIATGKPLLAFVENAPPNRGFSNFELTTALKHPDVRINGYPVSAFGPDPLAFVSASAAEYQALERTIAQQATINSGHAVDVAQIRRHLTPIQGWDAVDKTLFSRPVDEFHALNLADMTRVRAEWVAARPQFGSGPRLYADVPELTPHAPGQPGAPRGPPGAAAVAEMGGDAAHAARVSPGMKAAGVAGVALLAHDFATSGHKWVELNAQGNAAGADSTAAHFMGRNVGGALGGFVAGAGVGLATGSWTGPGALATGIGGGAVGAYLGERWADQKDIERIYTQVDPMGRTWTRDPADAEGRWLRGAHQQQVQSSDTGSGIEVRPVQDAQGQDVTFRAAYVASGTLGRQLNWQAARASYELGLANPPTPQDPYRLSASGVDQPPRAPFESGREFVRDPQSREWQLEIRETLDGRVPVIRHDAVSPERALALDEQSRTVIAQNAANTPAAMAARYMVAHAQERWSDFGGPDNPSIPQAVQQARDNANTLRASDGNDYTRQADGRWISEGLVFDSMANGNMAEQLDVTWRSQNAGVAEMTAMADGIRSSLELAPEGIRGQVAALYLKHGIERSESELAATSAAVEQSLASTGRPPDVVLELMPDPRTHAPGAGSAIAAFSDAGGNRMVLTATTTVEDVARVQASQQQASIAPERADEAVPTLGTVSVRPEQQAPVPDTPELRIEALSPKEQDAHRQALHEANRQGAATTDAQQAASVAALMANGAQPDPVRASAVETDVPRDREMGRMAVPPVQQPSMASTQAAEMAAASAAAASVPPVDPAAVPREAERPAELQRSAPSSTEAERAERQRQDELPAQRQEEAASERATTQAVDVPAAVPDTSARANQAEIEQARVTRTAEVPVAGPRDTAPAPAVAPPDATARVPVAAVQEGQGPERLRPSDETLQVASAPKEEVAQAADAGVVDSHRPPVLPGQVAVAQEPTAYESRMEHHAAPPQSQDPTQRDHPDFALYQQVRQGVATLDEKHGRSFDEVSERMSASLLVLAKDNDLSRVDHVLLSNATERNPAGHMLYVVQGEPNDPAHLRASMPTEQAAMTAVADSMQQFAVASELAEQRAVAQHQQQAETERTQQETQGALQRMG
ncbi:XVIPCD domain-containing protein [Stenotrophomonas chelatiphaga]|uniref:XVIPCD domain-containing protein n=1 Tax=Stenotrophomonas chelatiphaga TaxID=517011 RepID=UPI00289A834F|nr:XVIPCD domain-containing protein [Stenotrophomonas chelatiphaga]